MSTVTLPAPPVPSTPTEGSPHAAPVWPLALVLAVVLVVHIPAFLCLPVDADVSQWDLCARTVLDGGVMYRDALENNLPGMLWLHLAIRSVVGWSSEAIRMVDLAVLAAILILLLRWLPAGCSVRARLATACVLAVLYLTSTEWCHCQRDPWMLLPALLALELRWRRLSRAGASGSCAVEGLLWGAAFWLKPHVAVPAVVCGLASARWCLGRSVRLRRVMRDEVLVLAGGLTAGALGSVWLVASGAWPDFWDILVVWNREYVVDATPAAERAVLVAGLLIRLFPWVLVHLGAVPLAWGVLVRGARTEAPREVLLSALYLGWLAQVVLLQHVFDYVHLPAVILGVAVVCRHAIAHPGFPRAVVVVFLLCCVVFRLPALTAQRAEVWGRCVLEGSGPDLRDRLSLLPRGSWSDLEGVRAFLRDQGVKDGELSCYTMRALPLHLDLPCRPATRHFLLGNILPTFRGQRERVYAELAASRQRYLVCDVTLTSWKEGVPADRLVFRSGRYAVFAVDGPALRDWLERHVDL